MLTKNNMEVNYLAVYSVETNTKVDKGKRQQLCKKISKKKAKRFSIMEDVI